MKIKLEASERLMLENIALYSEGFDLTLAGFSVKQMVHSLREKNLVFVEDNVVFASNNIYNVEEIRL